MFYYFSNIFAAEESQMIMSYTGTTSLNGYTRKLISSDNLKHFVIIMRVFEVSTSQRFTGSWFKAPTSPLQFVWLLFRFSSNPSHSVFNQNSFIWSVLFTYPLQTLMNAHLALILLRTRTITTIVTLTPTVPTPRARSIARVTRDTLEMASRV